MTNEEVIKGLFEETMAGNGPRVIELTNEGLGNGMGPGSAPAE